MDFHSKSWEAFCKNSARQLGIRETCRQAGQFALHAAEMMTWNRTINLTAITDPREIAVKHFIDSLALANEIAAGTRLIDIGSGAGFPGVPLKIMMPSLHVTLVDASRKKVNFLKQMIRILKLENIDAIHIRVEDLPGNPAFFRAFDVAVCRAFSSLQRFAGLAAPLIKPDGKMIAMKGKNVDSEISTLMSTEKGRSENPDEFGSGFSAELRAYTLPHVDLRRFMVIITRRPMQLMDLAGFKLDTLP